MSETKILVSSSAMDDLVIEQRITNKLLSKMDKRQVKDWEEFKKEKKRQSRRDLLATIFFLVIGLISLLGLYFLPEEIKSGLNNYFDFVQGVLNWIRQDKVG